MESRVYNLFSSQGGCEFWHAGQVISRHYEEHGEVDAEAVLETLQGLVNNGSLELGILFGTKFYRR